MERPETNGIVSPVYRRSRSSERTLHRLEKKTKGSEEARGRGRMVRENAEKIMAVAEGRGQCEGPWRSDSARGSRKRVSGMIMRDRQEAIIAASLPSAPVWVYVAF